MKSKSIDMINIGLIIISFVIAFFLPFKLFLISYAILGPLHYLTELNWLKEQKFYFHKNNPQSWVWLYVIAAILISIAPVSRFTFSSENNYFQFLESYGSIVILSCFLISLLLAFINKQRVLFIGVTLSFIITSVFYFLSSGTVILIGFLLTTILHVYIFTLLFMVFGALKSKSKYAWISIILLIISPILLLIIPIDYHSYKMIGYTREVFESGNFLRLNQEIAGLAGVLHNGIHYVLSEDGIKIQIFIGFAYTYHYLNWFSKTTIIGWGKALNQKRSWIILTLWIFSVSLYAIDYQIGLLSLFFLSFLHVFAEFPLNWKSVYGMIKS